MARPMLKEFFCVVWQAAKRPKGGYLIRRQDIISETKQLSLGE